jgi:hypothetical protein
MKPTLDISKKTEATEIFEEAIYSALARVDKMEKEGNEDLERIAKNFMTVTLLIDIMETFDCLSEDWVERRRY